MTVFSIQPVLVLILLGWAHLSLAQQSPPPVALFDGETLQGWDYAAEVWRVEDGAITAGLQDGKFPRNHFISTQKNYANFDLGLKIRCAGDPGTGLINSGIQIRSARLADGSVAGYQVDCGVGWFGKIYDEHRRGLISPQPIDAKALSAVLDPYGWNEYRILAEGPRIQVWINGIKASDYTEKNPLVPLDGIIAPQIHSGGNVVVQVKDIRIRELPDTPGSPTWQSLGGVETALQKLKNSSKRQTKRKAPASDSNSKAKALKAGNDGSGVGPRSAVEQREMFHLPEGYEIELVVGESEGIGKFVSVCFDQRGRLWTQTALEYPVDANENRAAAEALYQSNARDKLLVYPREALNGALPGAGLSEPKVFADGLAIPLGFLPWGAGDSAYVLHGSDLLLLNDTDGDGIADGREVVLTGLGIQDSHLLPHQFTRAPGGWIWMAQGLFNHSQVRGPGEGAPIAWPGCSMARVRPGGEGFEVTSTGPNNIWGLAITGEGERFIQEANDLGYPVMPFHDYAFYPGGMKRHKETYQPVFPSAAGFRMGGTGLSGLALLESGPAQSPGAQITMLVANPITRKVQALAMHRDGAYWKLEQQPDFITCDDPLFRPVALTQGPDGCLYIVDWYNKIISHNEVPRNHPERDRTRGRIWRVKPATGLLPIADFSALGSEELLAMLGSRPTARAHLAWQTLADRRDPEVARLLRAELSSADTPGSSAARRIQALWILAENASFDGEEKRLLTSPNRNLRRELAGFPVHAPGLLEDPDPEVRFAALSTLGRVLPERAEEILPQLLAAVKPAPAASRNPASKRESYDREFERFLVRRFLEKHRDGIRLTDWLASEAAAEVPQEGRIWAMLATAPEESARLLADELPKLERPANSEEILSQARFAHLPECASALSRLLASEEGFAVTARTLLENQTQLAPEKLAALLEPVIDGMLSESGPRRLTAARLIGGFGVSSAAPRLIALLEESDLPLSDEEVGAFLLTLRQLKSDSPELFARLAFDSTRSQSLRDRAFLALVESGSAESAGLVLRAFPDLPAKRQRLAVEALAGKKASAEVLLGALLEGSLDHGLVSIPVAGKLHDVVGDSPRFKELVTKLGTVFRDVLSLDGSGEAWADSNLTLEGAFTLEAWVRLAPDISNADGLVGSRGSASINFHQARPRVWIAETERDLVIANRAIVPEIWTHLAVVRDLKGHFSIYLDGQKDSVGSVAYPQALVGLDVGWTPVNAGTRALITEFRVWNHARSDAQIRAWFDRSLDDAEQRPEGLVFHNSGGGENWGFLQKGATVVRTFDAPELMTREQAEELAASFEKYTGFIQSGQGDPETGELLAALCTSCHVIHGKGGQVGPDISGIGAMGHEAVLRNLLTPNAAMESGYRVYRVEMKNGDLVDAFFVSEDKDAVIVRQPGGPDRRIARSDIRRTAYLRRSLMPEGLLESLPDQSAADLLSYLMSLK